SYGYDAVGNRAGLLYPNGVAATYAYDGLDRLTRLTQTDGGGRTLRSYSLTLGPAGNRTRVVEDDGRTVDYAYDALLRLTGEAISGDPAGNNGAIAYTYDAAGNRLGRASTNPALASASYGYDAN